jgi:lysophospholipase L1-like esterase
MPLGDSITWGIAGSTDDTGYRRSLYFALTGAGFPVDFVGSSIDGIPDDFDKDHEGHGGWTAYEIVHGRTAKPLEGHLAVWLADVQPEIVLLHIGTNDLKNSPDDVQAILDEIDAFDPDAWVVLALIINRACSLDPVPCPEYQETVDFNYNVEDMAWGRINNPAKPAFPDKIVFVDMENGAGIDYHWSIGNPPGDMADNLHPFDTGYAKMADLWFSALMEILPQADAGPDQIVFDEITLDGSLSNDSDGEIISYQWQLNHRQNSDFNRTATGVSPIVLNLKKGFYDVTPIVEDDKGRTDTDQMFISATGPKGDFDFDGDVDGYDLSVFSEYYNITE